jgi:multidrug transporter EmrE-like cation transporter
MSQTGFLFLLLSAALTAFANLSLRVGLLRAGGLDLSAGAVLGDLFNLAKEPVFVIGVTAYGTAAVVWFRVISTENLTTSYPLMVGITFMLVTAAAIVFLREPISLLKGLGMVVIVAGIALVARG